MKYILLILALAITADVCAQQQGQVTSNQPTTHIQSPANATYQNNSQFYNKDNQTDASKLNTTGNGAYITPGNSNPRNTNMAPMPNSGQMIINVGDPIIATPVNNNAVIK